jgi:HEAT repeat protein
VRTCFVFSLFSLGIAFGQTPGSDTLSTQDRARNYLEDSLKDKNPDIRKHAVQALGLVSPREPYLSQLEAMLDDKDVEVRLATITSLVDLKNSRTVPALQKALDSNVPEVSFAAAKALWTLNEPVGREALVAVLSGETKTSSGFITKQKRDALRMLHTPKTMFLFALKQGANFAPVPGVGAGVSSLQGILSDPSVSGRATAALLLSADNEPEVVQALQDALADKDWSVRAAAVHAIALRNDPALETDLIPLLEDRKEAVRVRAAAGYLRLEGIKSGQGKSAGNQQLKRRIPAPLSAAGKK